MLQPSRFLIVLALLSAGAATAGELPRIAILATGGTIAGGGGSATADSYTAAQSTVGQLLAAVPELSTRARVTGEQVAQVGSQAMTTEIWLRLARRINALFADDAADGVVITHGTDTLEETAYFLHLVVEHDRPVVLVGSMRPATGLSADGPRNLFDAVAVAADPAAQGRGVLVVMNGEIHGARDVTKTNTVSLDTFRSPNLGPLGQVVGDAVRLIRRPGRVHTTASELRLGTHKNLPRVEIVYGHASDSRLFVDAAVKAGVQGIVLAGVGNGNPFPSTEVALADAVLKGVTVVRSSRVGSGPVIRNAEVDDDRLGFVVADSLNPQKARVLLMLALTRSAQAGALQGFFDRY